MSPLQRQIVFLHHLECDTKIFLSRRVCVCLSKTRGGGIQKARSVCYCAGAYKRVAEAES